MSGAKSVLELIENEEDESANNSNRTFNANFFDEDNIIPKSEELSNVDHHNILKLITKKWERFAEWIHCICVVTFDLELGQAMELIYPKHITLSEQEKTNICYLAFPDSNSGCMGDTQFHVRLRVAPGTTESLLSPVHARFNVECIPVQKADSGHYYGFVYFRQTKDNTIPRGYFQKSFIILTRLPFFNLFYEICSLVAPRYFQDGLPVIELACEQISIWPELRAGVSLTVELLGTVYQTVIPKSSSKTHSTAGMVESSNNSSSQNERTGINEKYCDIKQHFHGPTLPPQILSSVHEIDIFRSLSSVIAHIHMLWELALTAEPIVVMGTSPTECSHMVTSLISLIAPFSYCAESRPYFTIHDSEFKEFTQRVQGPPPIILGVTNPFFAKPLQNWPHIVRLNETLDNSPSSLLNGMSFTSNRMINGALQPSQFEPQGSQLSKLRKVKSLSTSSKIHDFSPGVYTKYKPFLQKDKNIIKKIIQGVKTKRPPSVQSALLRRHFLELSQSFMIPLERYMASLMPLQKDISPFKAAPNPNQFKQDDFLSTIEQSGPHLTAPLKGDWEGLYKRFFRSPNFRGWYEQREMELRQTLQALQLQALSNADMEKWAQGKHEVEIVDMILKLKQKLKLYSNTYHVSDEKNSLSGIGGDFNNSNSSGSSQRNPNSKINTRTYQTNNSGQIFLQNQLLNTSTRFQLIQQLDGMIKQLPDDLRTILNEEGNTAVAAGSVGGGGSSGSSHST